MDNAKAGLYAIMDTMAQDILGSTNAITIHKHEATAVRFFSDIAGTPGTLVNQHPEDCQLVRLAWLTDDNTILPDAAVILTGAQWKAAQPQPEAKP